MENLNQNLFEFIRRKTPNLKQILEAKIKDTDDEDGCIGEHYVVECIVECIVKEPDQSILSYCCKDFTRTCLVDAHEFRKWAKGEESVKWI